MENKGTKRLETDRLVLRQFKIEDTEDMHNNWTTDAEVTRFLTWSPHPDINFTKGLLENWISKYSEPTWYNWAIELKEAGYGEFMVAVNSQNVNAIQFYLAMGGKIVLSEEKQLRIEFIL